MSGGREGEDSRDILQLREYCQTDLPFLHLIKENLLYQPSALALYTYGESVNDFGSLGQDNLGAILTRLSERTHGPYEVMN